MTLLRGVQADEMACSPRCSCPMGGYPIEGQPMVGYPLRDYQWELSNERLPPGGFSLEGSYLKN